MSAANHSMLNMAARYGNAPAVRALLKAGAEASHADATGWHMPLHHVTHCRGCSEEVALRIAQMLVAAGAEPGLARDKNGVAAAVTSSHRFARPLAPPRLPSAAGYASACPKFRPASANQPLGPRSAGHICIHIERMCFRLSDHCDQSGDSAWVEVRREATASEASLKETVDTSEL